MPTANTPRERGERGESTIKLGEDGRWHGYVSMGLKAGGDRDRRHVAAKKRSDLVAKVRALEEQRDAGMALAAGRVPTVAQWMTLWLDTIASRRIRPSTAAGYRSCLKRIELHLGMHRLDRLQPEHLEAFYAVLEAEGLAASTVLLHHRVLSRALKVALQRGRIGRNVATLVDAPSARHIEVEPLTADEARKILKAAVGRDNAARWSVALGLGLRQGEALGLKWEDLDLETGRLTVRRALQRQTGKGLVLVEPKSRAGRRTVVLPEPLRRGLIAHQTWQETQRQAAQEAWEENGFVFCQPNGRPIDARRDGLDWKDLLKVAGVRHARLHDARHTAATLLLQQGVAARVAMQVLGHSQITLTLGTYSHVVPELAEDAAARMAKALWET